MAKGLGYVKKSKLNKKKKSQHKIGISYGKFIWIIYPILLILFIEILSHASLIPGIIFPFTNFFNFLLTFILVVWIGIGLYILFENKWISLNILNIIVFIIALGSRITIYNTDNGLALNNLGIFNNLNLLESTPGSVYIIFFILAIIFFLILNILIYFMYSWSLGLKHKLPIVLGVFLTFMIFSQLIAPKITSTQTKGFDVNTNGVLLFFNNGIFQNNFIQYPSQSEVLNIRENLNIEEKSTEIKPNIILVQLPYFIDLTEITELENDPLTNYHNIFNEGVNFYTDISIKEQEGLNSEFEVLTGLPDDWYPYEVQVRGDNLPEDTINIASILKADGYYTASILPKSKTESKREEFYEKLGFDKTILKEDLSADSPEVILDNIRETLADSENYPIFINTSLKVLQSDYENDPLNNYQNDLKILDGYIGELKEIIGLNTTPTVIVFYSGKLPTLGTENSLYKDLGYINNEKNLELLRKMNRGFAMIWNNYNKASNVKTGEIVDLSQLASVSLNYAEVNMPDYFYYFKNLNTDEGIEGYNTNYLAKEGILYSNETQIYKNYTNDINIVVKDILGPNKYFEKSKSKWLPVVDD